MDHYLFEPDQVYNAFMICVSVPGQPGKFQVGKVTDTSIELTWEPAYSKEPVKAYELIYKAPELGIQVRTCSSKKHLRATNQWYCHQLVGIMVVFSNGLC